MTGDYQQYERACQAIRKENAALLAEFANWLGAKGLSEATVQKHGAHIDFYVNEFLLYEGATPAAEGAVAAGMILGSWFMGKAMWASPPSIRASAASLEQFYQFMFERGRIDREALEVLKAQIKEGLPDWLATLKWYTAVLANPDADEPRDRLAELWIRAGDPRGELISVQMKLARQQDNGPQLRKRARKMIEKHGRQWSGGIADLVDKFYFRRGFVEHIKVEASVFLQIAETLYALAPIRHLTLTGAHAVANDLFASPHLSRIVSIALEHCELTDDDAILMAASPHLSRVRWLALGWNEIGRPGLDAIVSSEHLKQIQYLVLKFNRVEDPTLQPGGVNQQGVVLDLNIPPLNRALRDLHGDLPWLIYERDNSLDWLADRDI